LSFPNPHHSERGYSDLAEVTVAQNKPLGRWGKLVSSSAESSMASGGNSLLTLDLPPAPLAELINVMELYQSLFGITPDVRTLLMFHVVSLCVLLPFKLDRCNCSVVLCAPKRHSQAPQL